MELVVAQSHCLQFRQVCSVIHGHERQLSRCSPPKKLNEVVRMLSKDEKLGKSTPQRALARTTVQV